MLVQGLTLMKKKLRIVIVQLGNFMGAMLNFTYSYEQFLVPKFMIPPTWINFYSTNGLFASSMTDV